MKVIIAYVALLFLTTSCATQLPAEKVYIIEKPQRPMMPSRPESPTYHDLDAELIRKLNGDKNAQCLLNNIGKMACYVVELEAYASALEGVIDALTE